MSRATIPGVPATGQRNRRKPDVSMTWQPIAAGAQAEIRTAYACGQRPRTAGPNSSPP
jgi:hypothetical protein